MNTNNNDFFLAAAIENVIENVTMMREYDDCGVSSGSTVANSDYEYSDAENDDGVLSSMFSSVNFFKATTAATTNDDAATAATAATTEMNSNSLLVDKRNNDYDNDVETICGNIEIGLSSMGNNKKKLGGWKNKTGAKKKGASLVKENKRHRIMVRPARKLGGGGSGSCDAESTRRQRRKHRRNGWHVSRALTSVIGRKLFHNNNKHNEAVVSPLFEPTNKDIRKEGLGLEVIYYNKKQRGMAMI